MKADSKTRMNEFGQPIGFALPDWKPPPFPPHLPLRGRYCRLEPLSAAKHSRDVYEAQSADTDGARWTYLFHGPYDNFADYETWCVGAEGSRDPQFYAIVDGASGRAVGTCTYMRIEPRHGVIEIGNIYFSPSLSRTSATTEAMYLLMANAFALGYRRYEWKCDSCNLPSLAAATRFGLPTKDCFVRPSSTRVVIAIPAGFPSSMAIGTAASTTPIGVGSPKTTSTPAARRSCGCRN